MSTKKDTFPRYPWGRELFRLEVELEVGRDEPELAQCTRLELAHALARDPETGADLLERLWLLAVQPEAEREHLVHARVQRLERTDELAVAHRVGGRPVGTLAVRVL